MRFLHFLLLALVLIIGGIVVAWTAGALYFDLPMSAPVRTAAAITWSLAAVFGLFRGWRGRLVVLLGFLLIAGWWSTTLRPKQNRDWQPQVAVLAYATREGDQVTVHNIRNFEYRTATDFTPGTRHEPIASQVFASWICS